VAERDNIIFADGQKIENLKELNDIAADQHMKIIIYEDKVVMVKISSMNKSDGGTGWLTPPLDLG